MRSLDAVDAGGPAPAMPGTDAESLAYEVREAESPEVQGFTGGHTGAFPAILAAAIILLLVLLIFQKDETA